MKAVLTHKPGSIYDDLPEERYHFPATYLRQLEAAAGQFSRPTPRSEFEFRLQ